MPWKELSIALIVAGVVGIIAAIVLAKLGFGQPIEAVSKASRKALRAVTKRIMRRRG